MLMVDLSVAHHSQVLVSIQDIACGEFFHVDLVPLLTPQGADQAGDKSAIACHILHGVSDY